MGPQRGSAVEQGLSILVGDRETPSPRKGAITKLFGAILVMLGVLDSLLTLRGGVPAYEFLMLIFFGAAVFALGAIRATEQGAATETKG